VSQVKSLCRQWITHFEQLGWVLDDPEGVEERFRNFNSESVALIKETGIPPGFDPVLSQPDAITEFSNLELVDPSDYEFILIVTDREFRTTHPDHYKNSLIVRPKSLVLGLGCDRKTPMDLMENGIRLFLPTHHLSFQSVHSLATLDSKRSEQSIQGLCEKFNWPISYYSQEELDTVRGLEERTGMVEQFIASRSVSEPAAVLGAGSSELLIPKWRYQEKVSGNRVTLAAARIPFGSDSTSK